MLRTTRWKASIPASNVVRDFEPNTVTRNSSRNFLGQDSKDRHDDVFECPRSTLIAGEGVCVEGSLVVSANFQEGLIVKL
ncbi:MAG: hypothetical protein P8Z30_13885 [Acidobacteriota bacterium]